MLCLHQTRGMILGAPEMVKKSKMWLSGLMGSFSDLFLYDHKKKTKCNHIKQCSKNCCFTF